MFKNHFQNTVINFSAILLLVTLIATPIYFAKNVASVAGVKSETTYLLVSQVEKFPQMILNQEGNKYTLNFTKQSEKQAYQSVFIINNPTVDTKIYQIINKSESNKAFFGDNIAEVQTRITLPAQTSTPISIISNSENQNEKITFSLESI